MSATITPEGSAPGARVAGAIPEVRVIAILLSAPALAGTPWQRPPTPILDVLHAPELPTSAPSPDGRWLLQLTPVRYPPLADRAAPMHRLAGLRIDPRTGGSWGEDAAVSTDPTLLRVGDGSTRPLPLPDGVEVLDVDWAADGRRFALTTRAEDHVGLWVGDTTGRLQEVRGVALVPLLGDAVEWLPDQHRLLVKRVPAGRGEPPAPPAVPEGPIVRDARGVAAASSTYESRDLITSIYDEALFEHFTTAELAIVDAGRGRVETVGAPGVYGQVDASPDGAYLLVERLEAPWSYRVAWPRFAHDLEVWTIDGEPVATVASLPAAEQVPIDGEPEGPREVRWRQDADATLAWFEALDGGDPVAKVEHRDRVMQLSAPFADAPTELLRTPHRATGLAWAGDGLAILTQHERERRWVHVWTFDADVGAASAKPWYDLSEHERYADPGDPLLRTTKDGRRLVHREGDRVWFAGDGATPGGDRPFLDRRSLTTGEVERVFRSGPDVLERFVGFVDAEDGAFLLRRESPTEVPNLHLATIGARARGPVAPGEAAYPRTDRPVTAYADPAPALRGVTKRLVTYTREDGVPLSFTLYLPPGYREGDRLPTVVYAYPREYSDPATAGQVGGSDKSFVRLSGPSPLFFALDGYAVLDSTTMPVLGDPETAYDTFVEQLVMDAEAAIGKAVELGVTDPDRVGLMGHSHGGLMTATLLAHSDLFRAGIARSGAYNHTIRPFGWQNERRTLWEATDTYVGLSPVMFAPQIDEPLLLVHGGIDENPGTVPTQSERLFEAVRGVGGTARLVMLPFEGHHYLARESVEHVLWEQLAWFGEHVKQARPRS